MFYFDRPVFKKMNTENTPHAVRGQTNALRNTACIWDRTRPRSEATVFSYLMIPVNELPTTQSGGDYTEVWSKSHSPPHNLPSSDEQGEHSPSWQSLKTYLLLDTSNNLKYWCQLDCNFQPPCIPPPLASKLRVTFWPPTQHLAHFHCKMFSSVSTAPTRSATPVKT